MTASRVLPVVAAVALLTAGAAHAQDPPPPSEQPEAAAPAAVPRNTRARADRSDGEARAVRAPRRAEAGTSDTQEVQPRVRAVVPEASVANAEEQGGSRRRPGGGGAVSGGSGRGGSGETARPRSGGARRPDVDGGGRDDGQRAQAVPRSRAPRQPRTVYAAPNYGRRYYRGPSGLGYYFYDPWSWYGYGGWGGYYGYSGNTWGGYYGGPGYYGGGYGGGYGAYSGPYGWSIGGVRLKVEPNDAEVYVDGYYAGIVDDFDGIWQQLRLDDGGHRIEVRKPGLTPLTFDVMVQPGRTITYRGDMRVTP
jgi:hypothetical protein